MDIPQLLNLFLIEKDPKLNTGFRVQPYKYQIQGVTISLVLLGTPLLIKARFPLGSWPPGYTLARVQLLVASTPKPFLTRQLWVAMSQVQDPTFGLVKGIYPQPFPHPVSK